MLWLLSIVPYPMRVSVRANGVQLVLNLVQKGKAAAANVCGVMQMELVVVYQVFEEPNKEAYSGPWEMGPEAFNPLIGVCVP